jgi:hypothetical protein
MKYKGLWKINNEAFKECVTKKYLMDPKVVKQLHAEIADILDKTPNSIRKLEEQTYHLFVSKSYFKLKEAVSSIENFLLLFNPNNKYDLCRYWQILEQNGFDPACDYNKAIEGFEMHYRPVAEDMFRIVIQISRFLKEFSDFETRVTPEFKHPPIKGGKELTEIGIRKEIKKMTMFIPEEWGEEDEELDEMEDLQFEIMGDLKGSALMGEAKDIVKEIHSTLKVKKPLKTKGMTESATFLTGMIPNSPTKALSQSVATLPKKQLLVPIQREEPKNHSKNRDPPILNEMEALNVDIPDNRQKVRNHFLKLIGNNGDHHNEEDDIPHQLGHVIHENEAIATEDSDQDTERVPTKHGENADKNFLVDMAAVNRKNKKGRGKGGAHHEKMGISDRQATYYYYKRWVWMIFPWACENFKTNYSQIIFECFSSPTRYMSVSEERKYTQDALRIAIEAKIKKKAMYATKPTELDTKSLKGSITGGRKLLEGIKSPSNMSINNTLDVPLTESLVKKKSLLNVNGRTSESQLSFQGSNTISPIEQKDHFLTQKRPAGGEKHFFITNEFLNFNNLNHSMDSNDYITNETNKPKGGGSATQTLERSMVSVSLLNKSKSMKNAGKIDKHFEKLAKVADYDDANALLPKFQSNLQDQNDKEVLQFELKVHRLQKELNDLVFKNKTLAKQLKNLAVSNHNLTAAAGSDVMLQARTKAQQLQVSVEKAEKSAQNSHQEQVRLLKIIFVCQKNKKQNEPWIRSLNFLLQNLKKMIKWEIESMTKLQYQINDMKKLLDSYLKAYNDKFKNHKVMIEQLRNKLDSKEILAQQIVSVDNALENSAYETAERLQNVYKSPKASKDQKMKFAQLEKNTKTMQDKLETLSKLYEKSKGIVGSDGYEDSDKFKDFMDNIIKKNDLERITYEKKEHIKDLRHQVEDKKKFLETLKKARLGKEATVHIEESKAETAGGDKKDLENVIRTQDQVQEQVQYKIGKTTRAILYSQMILTKICQEIDLEYHSEHVVIDKLPVQEIVDHLEGKMDFIKKNCTEEVFNMFEHGKLDFKPFYSKINSNNPEQQITSLNVQYGKICVKGHEGEVPKPEEHSIIDPHSEPQASHLDSLKSTPSKAGQDHTDKIDASATKPGEPLSKTSTLTQPGEQPVQKTVTIATPAEQSIQKSPTVASTNNQPLSPSQTITQPSAQPNVAQPNAAQPTTTAPANTQPASNTTPVQPNQPLKPSTTIVNPVPANQPVSTTTPAQPASTTIPAQPTK